MDKAQIKAIMSSSLEAWGKLSALEQNLLLDNTREISFKKGTNIHNGDNDCLGLMLIVSGELRTYLLSEEGREITLYRLRDGDFCVLSASCVLSNITFEVHIDAETPVRALLVNSGAFSSLTAKNVNLECYSYKLLTDRFSDVMWSMQQILFMSLDKRLATFLLDESASQKSDVLKITHEQAAKYMGSAREAVSRMLKYFEDEGLVELSRGSIKLLDKKKLRGIL